MADNLGYTPGTGATTATDDVAGVHYQRVKLDVGGDGASVPASGDAGNGLDVDVTRVQGSVTVISGTAANLKVDASGVAVPVTDNTGSLTVDAPVGTPVAVRPSNGSAFVDPALEHVAAASPHSARLSDGSAFYDAAKTGQIPAALVNARLDVNLGAAPAVVTVADGGGSLTVDDGAGSLTVDDGAGSLTVDGTVTGNQGTAAAASAAWPVKVSDGTDTVGISTVSAAKALKVDVIQDVGAAALADKAAFVEGTTKAIPVAGVLNDTISADPAEDQAAAVRITAKRGLHVSLRAAAGTEIGSASAPLRVDPTGGTAQVVNQGTANATPWTSNLTKVNGTAVGEAAAGIQKVGIVDEAGAAFSESNPLPIEVGAMGRTRVRSQVTFAPNETVMSIWAPAGGKKFVVLSLTVVMSTGGPLTIFDSTNTPVYCLVKGTFPVGVHRFDFAHGWPSSTVNFALRYTTGAAAVGDITVDGYEV